MIDVGTNAISALHTKLNKINEAIAAHTRTLSTIQKFRKDTHRTIRIALDADYTQWSAELDPKAGEIVIDMVIEEAAEKILNLQKEYEMLMREYLK